MNVTPAGNKAPEQQEDTDPEHTHDTPRKAWTRDTEDGFLVCRRHSPNARSFRPTGSGAGNTGGGRVYRSPWRASKSDLLPDQGPLSAFLWKVGPRRRQETGVSLAVAGALPHHVQPARPRFRWSLGTHATKQPSVGTLPRDLPQTFSRGLLLHLCLQAQRTERRTSLMHTRFEAKRPRPDAEGAAKSLSA